MRSLISRLRNSGSSSPAINPLVVIYTPGKDGGTSARDAVRRSGLECHHIHHLDPKILKQNMRRALDNDELPGDYVCMAAAIRRDMIEQRRDIRIVLLVRDQLERTLAALYQNLHTRTDGLTLNSPPEDIFAEWRDRTNHTWGLDWVNREYRDQLGIDVLSLPFDRDKRVQHHQDHSLLIMRIDADTQVKEHALSTLVGRTVTLGHANVGAQKHYADSYRAVKAMAWAPEPLIKQVYTHAHHQHFWTPSELDGMMERWRVNRPQGD